MLGSGRDLRSVCKENIMRKICLLLIATIILAVGCTKKSTVEPSAFTVHQEIPSTAVAFLEFDNNSASGKRFRESKWAKDFKVVPSELKEVLIVQKLSKEIAFSEESSRKGSISEGITYYAVEGIIAPQINFGGILKANPAKDISWTKDLVLNELKAAGIPVTEESDPKVGAFLQVKVDAINADAPSNIFIVISKDKFSFASRKEYLGIGTPDLGDKNPMASDSRFLAGLAQAKNSGAFQFGAIDIGRIMPYLQAEALRINPAADLGAIPYELALFGISYDKGYSVQGALHTIQGSVDPKASTRNNKSLAELVPDSSVFSMELSAPLLLASLGGDLTPLPGAEILNSISRLAIFVKEGGIGSIAPDLTLVVSSSDTNRTRSEVVKLVDTLSSLVPGAVSPRQQAKVGEIDIDFLVSPIGGLGVFIGNFEGSTIISSSENTFKDYQDSAKRSANLRSVLSSQNVSPDNSIMSGHIDFPKTLTLMDNLKGTAALFAPQREVPSNDVADQMIRNLGFMSYKLQEFDTKAEFSLIFRE